MPVLAPRAPLAPSHDPERLSWHEPVMGTVASIHVISDGPTRVLRRAVEGCLAELREIEDMFSPFRPQSAISRIARRELALEDADPLVGIVAEACRDAQESTSGRFSAWRDGTFDPTGFVKGWAVERAARRHLEPLLAEPGCLAAGLNVGGDMQLLTAPGAEWSWRVGIADPRHPGALLATLDIVRGAVATSGTAERGTHIIDPRTGSASTSVASATVVADSLTIADVWATAAVVAGCDDLSWVAGSHTTTGIIVGDDGRVRRWIAGIEVHVEGESGDLAPLLARA